MAWLMVHVTTSTEAVDAVANMLLERGAEGVQIEDSADFRQPLVTGAGEPIDPALIPHLTEGARVTGYFNDQVDAPALQTAVLAQVALLPSFGLAKGAGTVTTALLADATWANTWKQYYRPLRLTRFLTVVPEWLDYQPTCPDEKLIRLDPDQAFGTGSHPTTALILGLLEQSLRGGEEVLDVGTGSGILAIAARMLGAKHVLATDIDDKAVANAEANIARNALTGIDVVVADGLTATMPQADLVLANILAEVLVPLIPQVPAVLKPDGKLLLSGIFHDKVAVITQTLHESGMQVAVLQQAGDWTALVAQRIPKEA
ncbi:50S ribosomal protein L11 methyltransferase [Lacticaseibacillus mingshuiensis]|uniref:Ribosomal protein L11 methyltransferase n=1 Tax=Lacticaseibacillus mingshuiensis TaxID=2799574 RepID=A0ABW4CGI6_9LACO|nr:50S ribosomal protein L11 methyltransferase [Lacticaseibacillus mingshuiensis]